MQTERKQLTTAVKTDGEECLSAGNAVTTIAVMQVAITSETEEWQEDANQVLSFK